MGGREVSPGSGAQNLLHRVSGCRGECAAEHTTRGAREPASLAEGRFGGGQKGFPAFGRPCAEAGWALKARGAAGEGPRCVREVGTYWVSVLGRVRPEGNGRGCSPTQEQSPAPASETLVPLSSEVHLGRRALDNSSELPMSPGGMQRRRERRGHGREKPGQTGVRTPV